MNTAFAIPLNRDVELSGDEQMIMGVPHFHVEYRDGERRIGVWLTKEEMIIHKDNDK